jgi:uncharacterized protein YjbJ (UPF0337 family)
VAEACGEMAADGRGDWCNWSTSSPTSGKNETNNNGLIAGSAFCNGRSTISGHSACFGTHWTIEPKMHASRSLPSQRRMIMVDKDRVGGAADKAKGAIKEGASKLTGDQKLQGEGAADKAKGAAKSAVGGIKDTIRDATKR